MSKLCRTSRKIDAWLKVLGSLAKMAMQVKVGLGLSIFKAETYHVIAVSVLSQSQTYIG